MKYFDDACSHVQTPLELPKYTRSNGGLRYRYCRPYSCNLLHPWPLPLVPVEWWNSQL